MSIPSDCYNDAQLMLDTSLKIIRTEATSWIINLLRKYFALDYNATALDMQATNASIRRVLEKALSHAHRMINVKVNGKDSIVVPAASFRTDADLVMERLDIAKLLSPEISESD